MDTKVSAYIVVCQGGLKLGPFDSADAAASWISQNGTNLAGPLNIEVVFEAPVYPSRTYTGAL